MADSYEILAALLKKVEAGELPEKKANMLKNLGGKVASGLPITEMQAELLGDLGQQYGLASD
jgi:hypothetical protein